LQRIKITMKSIAIIIDEEQLNRYITNDFDPLIDDDDDDDDDDAVEKIDESSPTSWETFAGWSFSNDVTPGFVDTDESSQDIDSDIGFTDFDLTKRPVTSSAGVDRIVVTDSPASDSFDDDDDSDESDLDRTDPYTMRMKPPVLAQSILRKIAREAVRYESDSEAADSWAQDGNCGASDATSSSEAGDAATTLSGNNYNSSPRTAGSSSLDVPVISCDPARLAFRSIMSRHTRHLQSLQVEMESLLSFEPLPHRHQPTHPPILDIVAPSTFADLEEEKKENDENQSDQELNNDDDDKNSTPTSTEKFDALPIPLSLPLPPPAISAPQVIDQQFMEVVSTLSKTVISELPTKPLVPREESPFRPITESTPETPHNSPNDAVVTTVSHCWGVQLRRLTMPQPHCR
jgi:hypothetical protein